MSTNMMLTDQQFLGALERLRDKINEGHALDFIDSNEIGNKFTECSWGVCTNATDIWPTDTRAFPDRIESPPKYGRKHHACPFDRRGMGSVDPDVMYTGCFYHCMIFNPTTPRPDRTKAIELYVARINEFRKLTGLQADQSTDTPSNSAVYIRSSGVFEVVSKQWAIARGLLLLEANVAVHPDELTVVFQAKERTPKS